jgi:hypothetical protein
MEKEEKKKYFSFYALKDQPCTLPRISWQLENVIGQTYLLAYHW